MVSQELNHISMNSKRKLLYIISKLGMGGAQNIVINLVNGLVRLGFEVDLIVFFRTPQDRENILRLDERVRLISDFEFPNWLSSDHDKPALKLLFFLAVPFLIFGKTLKDREFFSKYDFVHSHLLMASQFSYFLDLFLKILNVSSPKFSETFHADFTTITKLEASLFLFFWRHLDTLVLELRRRDADYIRSVLQNVEIHYITFGIPILPNGYRMEQQPDFLKQHLVEPKTCVVSISRLNNQEKKVNKLIEVVYQLKMIRGDTFTFILCGDGPDRDEIQQQVIVLGLETNVLFTGYINDVYALLSIARAFLIMGIEDLVGIAGLQAASVGVPVVSYQGDPMWISSSQDAFFNSSSPVELATHLNRLIEDDILYGFEASRSRRLVHEKFSFEVILSKYAALYEGKVVS